MWFWMGQRRRAIEIVYSKQDLEYILQYGIGKQQNNASIEVIENLPCVLVQYRKLYESLERAEPFFER